MFFVRLILVHLKKKTFYCDWHKKIIDRYCAIANRDFSEKDYRTVQDAIGDLQNVPTVTDVAEDIGTPLKRLMI